MAHSHRFFSKLSSAPPSDLIFSSCTNVETSSGISNVRRLLDCFYFTRFYQTRKFLCRLQIRFVNNILHAGSLFRLVFVCRYFFLSLITRVFFDCHSAFLLLFFFIFMIKIILIISFYEKSQKKFRIS